MMRSKSIPFISTQPIRLVSLLILATLIIAACQPAAIPPPAQPTAVPTAAPTTAPVAASQAPTIDVVTDPKLGQILVGDKGMTLYIFTKDEPGKSNCDADCLKKWPPLLTQGNPSLGAGVDASLVGTATLADGSKIVTYNQMPLYYWYKDAKPGDTTGEGVGDVWYVLAPTGTMVTLQSPNQPANPPANNDKADKGDSY
jgi:predicted lipoprotein with Yx(FWY)xxD motif